MTFLRHKDNIVNLERITRIYKEETVCERPTGFGVMASYKVVLAGDNQELKIRCDSEDEADKILNTIEGLLKKCYGLYEYTEISNYNDRITKS